MASSQQSVAQNIARALGPRGVEVIFGHSLPFAVILACAEAPVSIQSSGVLKGEEHAVSP